MATALAWVIITIAAGGAGLAWSLRSTLADSFDARLQTTLMTLIGSIEAGANGELTLARSLGDPRFDQVYSGVYWAVATDKRVVLRSRSLWDLELQPHVAAISSTARWRTMRDSLGKELRIVEQTVSLPRAATPVTFVVANDLAPLIAEASGFNRLLWTTLILLGAGLVIAIVAQVSFGLRPLRRVATNIEQVRMGVSEQLASTGMQELDTLVEEVNSLIEQNRRTLERARSQAVDLAHALKTPLSIVRVTMSDSRQELQHVDAMQRIIDRHLARAASAGPRRGVTTPLKPVVDSLLSGMRKLYAARELTLQGNVAPSLLFSGDGEDLEEMLGNLLDNACKWARRNVLVNAGIRESELVIVIDDDGQGLANDQPLRAVERGLRFDETVPGTGLGLAIVSDLAVLYSGSLRLCAAPSGGLRVELRLPGRSRA